LSHVDFWLEDEDGNEIVSKEAGRYMPQQYSPGNNSLDKSIKLPHIFLNSLPKSIIIAAP